MNNVYRENEGNVSVCAQLHGLLFNKSVWSSGTKDVTARLELSWKIHTGVTRLKDITEIPEITATA